MTVGRTKRYVAVHWMSEFAFGFGRPMDGIWKAIALMGAQQGKGDQIPGGGSPLHSSGWKLATDP